MTSVKDIRRTFLEFFEKHGHTIVPSDSLIPANDPTLMFTSAGMVQFKNLFTGAETRDYTRATSSQKCLRAGGKHNDLENVGYTARHHTFFEMLGNFSFGNYFKEEAIKLAWDLVTKEFALDKNRLTVTVYHTDEEAVTHWKKIAGLSDDKIIRIATSDNFWSAGDTGPCGPCTEIFYDHGDHIVGGPPGSPDEDGDRFVEIWNLVFMQYDQLASGERVDLPKPSIDTGSGLERMAAVLQNTHDNYAIDLMRAIIEASAHETSSNVDSVSHRIIADHLRAACFMIGDGILPSNEGRGYVLRRIMRRGMRHAHLLGAKDPLMYRLVPTLQNMMGESYPELTEAGDLITATLKQEELRFKKTLDKGLSLLEAETENLAEGKALSGDVAFKLYDTFGFPLDLTQDVLRREQSRDVDVAGFDAAMEKQREMARKSWAGSGEAATEQVWFDIKDKHGATEFLGYAQTRAEGNVIALINDKGDPVETVKPGESVLIVTNQTPFYGESGGQVGDCGRLFTADVEIEVTDTQKKLGSVFVHIGSVKKGTVSVGDTMTMAIDVERRNDIRANHSATHLLHAALRRHLGNHVAQKGSQVSAQALRFDISHNQAMTREEIQKVEDEVNDRIRMNTDVSTRLMPVEEARAAGAIAMFGEKYDDEVRVLAMGGQDPDQPEKFYSLELCGGTHVKRTGDIGLIKITAESALAAGVRRVEAVTGRGAMAYLNEQETRLCEVSQTLKAAPAEVVERVEALLADKKKLEREASDLRRKLATGGGGGAKMESKVINGINFTGKVLEGISAKELKPLADEMKAKMGSGVVALVAVSEEGKASLVVGVTKDMTDRINAVDLVRAGSAVLGGKGGGGRPEMAQAGGPIGAKAGDAVGAIEAVLAG